MSPTEMNAESPRKAPRRDLNFRKLLNTVRAEVREAVEPDWPFRKAAAVLSRFVPERLHPYGVLTGASDPRKEVGWEDFFRDCKPVPNVGPGWWELREEVRRATLLAYKDGRRELMAALNSNRDRSDDPVQKMIDLVVLNPSTSFELDRIPREHLAALITVVEWFSELIPSLPPEHALRHALARADLLAPMRRLIDGPSFVGRVEELEELRDYVGVKPADGAGRSIWRFVREQYYDLTSRPPLMLSGPGGIGKSTLLAHFILDHSATRNPEEALPFVYLDFDRPHLLASKPLSLLAEAANQLAIQWPGSLQALRNISDQVAPMLFGEQDFTLDGVKMLHDRADLVEKFAACVQKESGGNPLLFIVDTFEEVQFLGLDMVQNVWSLLEMLQRQAPMLRIVLAGRGDLSRAFPSRVRMVPLDDLSAEDALKMLRYEVGDLRELQAAQAESLLREVVAIVGRNPLSLKLAAVILKDKEGITQLRNVETRNLLLLRVKAETVQARLYGRILGHIHDPQIKRLAYPGLVVRRITADVIRKVLAGPCGISIDGPNSPSAENLMIALSAEVALVEPDPDGALRHRQDVRRIMLPDLADEVSPDVIASIHNAAVEYYASLSDPVSRGEEIYHRLMRGDSTESVKTRWAPAAGQYLNNALEELMPEARVWLSTRLGVTPDAALVKQADLRAWEQVTTRSVQRLLEAGDATGALRRIRERDERSPASPLFRLEFDALRLLGRNREAREVAQRGIEMAARAGAPAMHRDLNLQLSLLEEAANDLLSALKYIQEALDAVGNQPEAIDQLRLLVTKIRLLRKLGDEYDDKRRVEIEAAQKLLDRETVEALQRRPAVLRELVAELGVIDSRILAQGLENIGLPIRNSTQANTLADSLTNWSNMINVRFDSPWENQLNSLREGDSEVTASLARDILRFRADFGANREVDKAVVTVFRDNVEQALQVASTIVR